MLESHNERSLIHALWSFMNPVQNKVNKSHVEERCFPSTYNYGYFRSETLPNNVPNPVTARSMGWRGKAVPVLN